MNSAYEMKHSLVIVDIEEDWADNHMLQSSLADQIPQIILFKEITLKLCEKKNTFVFNTLTLCAYLKSLLLL